jgi:hypothetical protein
MKPGEDYFDTHASVANVPPIDPIPRTAIGVGN